MKKLNPSDIVFDAKKRSGRVSVLLATKDEDSEHSDNIGRHNANGLPIFLGEEVSECEFEVSDMSLEEVKEGMVLAGFTYERIGNW